MNEVELDQVRALVIAAPLGCTAHTQALSAALCTEVTVLVGDRMLMCRCNGVFVLGSTRLQRWWWKRHCTCHWYAIIAAWSTPALTHDFLLQLSKHTGRI
jgi:hypothetical protein